MPYRSLEPFSKRLIIIIGLTVVGFMTFGLALSFYRNVLFDQTLKDISQQNEKLQQSILADQNQLDYYQSAQYKDKYAKESLGRLNRGEKMLIIEKDPSLPNLQAGAGLSPGEAAQAAYEEHLRELPVYLHWDLYLFHRDKIEELKKGFERQ